MKQILKIFLEGIVYFIGIAFALYSLAFIFNLVEKYMLSQNCDKYFEVLFEQNLVPHRCYLGENANKQTNLLEKEGTK